MQRKYEEMLIEADPFWQKETLRCNIYTLVLKLLTYLTDDVKEKFNIRSFDDIINILNTGSEIKGTEISYLRAFKDNMLCLTKSKSLWKTLKYLVHNYELDISTVVDDIEEYREYSKNFDGDYDEDSDEYSDYSSNYGNVCCNIHNYGGISSLSTLFTSYPYTAPWFSALRDKFNEDRNDI
jgi:hypothetical protein